MRNIRAVLLIATLLGLTLAFQNCSLDAPSGDAESALNSASPDPQTTPNPSPTTAPAPAPAPAPMPAPMPPPPPACGGVMLGGFCFYASAASDSCDSTCSTRGGCDDPGLAYANSANCQTVMNGLGHTASVTVPGTGYAVGCIHSSAFFVYYPSNTATCAAVLNGAVRACPCKK